MNLSGTHEAPGAEEELGEDWEKISRSLPQLVQNLPKEKLLRFSASSDLSSILAGLYRDGAVILENIQSPEACDRVKEDMRPYVDRAAYGDGFLGKQTKRASAVVARSRTSWGFVQHPLLLQICKGEHLNILCILDSNRMVLENVLSCVVGCAHMCVINGCPRCIEPTDTSREDKGGTC